MSAPKLWSKIRKREMSLQWYWNRYRAEVDPPTIAELAEEACITPSSLAARFEEHFKDYKQIANSRRCGKSQILMKDEGYVTLFKQYRADASLTLADLARERKVSRSSLSQHFSRLFGDIYKEISVNRRAHTQ